MKPLRVGLVSDTHGLFEPRLARLLSGCDLILHAGDVVRPSILADLARLAPVRAVRGNNDGDPAFDALPEVAHLDLAGRSTIVIHEIGSRARLALPARRAVARHAARIVVHGHSHRPAAALEDGVLFVNPGSAGPRRFSLPRAAGLLLLGRREVEVRLHDVARDDLPLLVPPLAIDL
ncbi:MAG TPA: metallophosphoesterase family protein [Anaeromyxobacteraceae bacterium]|nr:metallophosphoesterase family protein [Anaeromyxobacteraceae bacterium]